MEQSDGKLQFKEKFCYGFGDLASCLYWQTFMLYFTYFYTDVFLLPAGIAATMFLITRIFDGVNDPVMINEPNEPYIFPIQTLVQ